MSWKMEKTLEQRSAGSSAGILTGCKSCSTDPIRQRTPSKSAAESHRTEKYLISALSSQRRVPIRYWLNALFGTLHARNSVGLRLPAYVTSSGGGPAEAESVHALPPPVSEGGSGGLRIEIAFNSPD